ncbi:D-aminoacylase [Paraburkholderia sp. J63]|uniref:N-acyl-D-amino-acid deacylase family protein n=1 Tax=Paraburkholderia sp. J63 TaxID=2805434 RepID=UPI002ABE7CEA|nr:D-aminoacylase [Paraburkholderia sp. J63]
MFDWILSGGLVIDGSGGEPYKADIGIESDVITAIGDLGRADSRERKDVAGKVVAPGFIDVHTHDDRALLVNRDMDEKISQGVTTVVVGNCGISLAPLRRREIPPPLNIVGESEWFKYDTFAEYLADLDQHPAAVNAVPLVGLTSLRAGALDDLTLPASEAQIAVMKQGLVDSMEAGAFGASCGTFYPPAAAADADEVIGVVEPLGRYDAILSVHLRDESDGILESLAEAAHIGTRTGARIVISHHKLVGINNHGRSTETLKFIQNNFAANRYGVDCYPYDAASSMLLPKLIELSSESYITWSEGCPECAGMKFDDAVRHLGVARDAAIEQLQPAGAVYFMMRDDDVQRILAYEKTMVGSDGLPHDLHPHPRLWGSFPRVFSRYVRDIPLLSMETAVRKMTGLTSDTFSLAKRGYLREGYYADVTVFDPAVISDLATYEQPNVRSVGIEHVWVNGRPAMLDTYRLPDRCGRTLRRNR